MAKAKSTKKKAGKATAKVTKKAAPAAKPAAKKAKAAAPAKAVKAKSPAPKESAKPTPQAAKPAAPSPPAESNWTDAIKAALERRQQQPDYPGSGSSSWKNRPKN